MTNSEEESDRTQESRKVLKSLLGEIVVLAESDTQELRLKTAKGIFTLVTSESVAKTLN